MKVSFHPEAEAEFLGAIAWYEERLPQLGLDFANEIHASIQRAVSMPLAWPRIDGDIRGVIARRFPYGVLYAQRGEGVVVLAVMHLQRQPDY